MQIKSKFGILDVLGDTEDLEIRTADQGPIEVIIKGRIMSAWGSHDGESQEFELEIDQVTETPSKSTLNRRRLARV